MLTESLPVNIGRYQIKSLVGRGGMGNLYLARDPNTNRLVALKLLNASFHSADLRERFAREARALAAMENHPNIVIIHDYGEFQGSPFIVMEYVRGETIAEKIKRRATLTIGQKLKFVSELCAGLAHVHEVGIIHRDIKPANLMVEQHGRLKILDFGIARVAEGNMTRMGMQMTQVNMRIGTPGYMSPEQIEGNEIDHRSDLFAVGTVFYELLTFREAFTGGNTRQIENKVLESQPLPIESLVRDIDPEIVAIVARALEKDPSRRFQNAEEFEQAIEHQRWRLGPATPKPTPAPSPQTPPPSPSPGRSSRDVRADAAFQRSLSVYKDGAEDAARRFAIEALAEDPNHLGARELLDQIDPRPVMDGTEVLVPDDEPISATAVAGQTAVAGHTVARGSGSSSSSATIVRGPATVSAWQRFQVQFRPYLIATAIVGSVIVIAGVLALVIGAGGWLSSGSALTISKPTGGTIIANGINCGTQGSNCSTTFKKGEIVELQVRADSGFLFGGYTGDCATGGRTTMTGARHCGATFDPVPAAAAKPTRTLTIVAPKGGTIVSLGITCGTLGTECTANHADGTQVKLDALADTGFAFVRYTGACAPDGQTTMTEARACGATFVQAQAGAAARGGGGPTQPALPPREARGPTPTDAPPPKPDLAPLPVNAIEPVAPPVTRTTGSNLPLAKVPEIPPPPPPELTAKALIQDLLKQYCAAFDRLDFGALRKLYPTAPDSVRESFRQYKSMQCTVAGPPEYAELDAIGGTAKLDVGIKQATDMKVGGEKVQNLTTTLSLTRPDPRGDWVINSASSKVKK